ncbi:MAG TPA: DUF4214 domain-containing protein [Pyrinomonadaceae bacterium]|nr:DUF4214 domain-containing protein [Pyrinomonadaceae bacterium]
MINFPKRLLASIIAGLLGLWLFHIPQFASNFDKFPGDRGDARLVVYLMEHWYQVFQGMANWRSPSMFYPAEGTIGYADLMLGLGIVHSVFRALGLGMFEAAEATIILLNFLNYLVCFILLNRVLKLNLLASIAGAAFFAFNNPKLVQLGHTQLQPLLFLPLAVIGVVLFVQKRDTLSQKQAFGLMTLSGISLALQLMTGFYTGWFFIFWSGLFLILALLFKTTRSVIVDQVKRFWPALLGALGVFLVALIPFVIAYLPIVRSVGGRPYHEIVGFIPVRWSLLLMSDRNYLWGTISENILTKHPLHLELQIAIGLIPSLAWLALTLIAIWFMIRSTRYKLKPAHLFLVLMIVATSLVYLLGMRYWDFSPWKFVHAFVPGAQAIRAVSRYALVMALPMAIGFAFLIHFIFERIAQSPSPRRIVLSAFLVLISGFGLFEQFAAPQGFDGFSIKAENEYLNRLAHSLPDNCSSFYVAAKTTALHSQFEYHVDAALVSAIKGVPTLNGYSGQLPMNWHLWDVMGGPAYDANVKSWIAERQVKGEVCRVFVTETNAATNLGDIADNEPFIRQQYLDILRREPDQPGLQTWLAKLNNCTRQGGRGADPSCDRVSVSMGILESSEFIERSGFVLRLYFAALGRRPSFTEFTGDRAAIVTAPAEELPAAKQRLIADLIERPEFKARQDQLSADNLLALIEDPETIRAYRDSSYVLMQFFANLNRDPHTWEYNSRLKRLHFTGEYRQLIFDFLYSVEYRKRFGYVN